MPIANEKLIVERLRAMQLQDKDNADSEYVHVDEKAMGKGQASRTRAPWTTLSIEEVGDWEHELLQDPKNKLVLLLRRDRLIG